MNNLTQTIQQLNKAPDGYLQQLVASKGPLSTFALVVQDQRQHLRNSMQPAPAGKQPSVAEQVAMRAQPEPAMSGEPMQQGLGALPVQMASGGIVAFDDGGDVPQAADTPMSYEDQMSNLWNALKSAPVSALKKLVSAPDTGSTAPSAQAEDAQRKAQAAAFDAQVAAQERRNQPPPASKLGARDPVNTSAADAGSPAEQGIRTSAADAKEATLANWDMSNLPQSIATIQNIAKTSPELGATLIAQLKERAKSLDIPWPKAGAAEAPKEAPTASPLEVAAQKVLTDSMAKKIPDLSLKDAAAKVDSGQDLYGIPALIAQREAAAAKYQDAQDAAVARKRAVTEKQNGPGAAFANMMDAVNTAIGKRTVYKRADLPGAAISANTAFTKDSQTREAEQVKTEDAQRTMRYDMESKLHEAKVLYAQGKTQAAEALVAKVVADQEALRKGQVDTAEKVAGYGVSERNNDRTVGASKYHTDVSAATSRENTEDRIAAGVAAIAAKNDPSKRAIESIKAATARIALLQRTNPYDPTAVEEINQLKQQISADQRIVNGQTGAELPAAPASGFKIIK